MGANGRSVGRGLIVCVVAIIMVLGQACGDDTADLVAVKDAPRWTENDAKAKVRDYIVSLAEDATVIRLWLTFEGRIIDWNASYQGEGWWHVSSTKLGLATTTSGSPTRFMRASGVWMVSERTSSVIAQNEAASVLATCVIVENLQCFQEVPQ